MAEISHPETDDSIEVEIIDRESYHGDEAVQVQAVDDGVKLSDESGDAPWMDAEDVVSDTEGQNA